MAQHRRSSTRHRMARSAGYVSAGFALALGLSGCGADAGETPASVSAPANPNTVAPAGATSPTAAVVAPSATPAAATAPPPAAAVHAPATRAHVTPRRPAVVTPRPRLVPRAPAVPRPAPPATGARAGTYTNSRGQQIERPDANAAGATAVCKDGTDSHSASRSGTCSRHGGVARWL